MEAKMLTELLLVLALAWILFDTRKRDSVTRRLEHELRARQPVFSAETIHGKEAEFIRDRLPRKWPRVLLMLVALGLLGTLAWWLTP